MQTASPAGPTAMATLAGKTRKTGKTRMASLARKTAMATLAGSR
jgi:hypothetical protein